MMYADKICNNTRNQAEAFQCIKIASGELGLTFRRCLVQVVRNPFELGDGQALQDP